MYSALGQDVILDLALYKFGIFICLFIYTTYRYCWIFHVDEAIPQSILGWIRYPYYVYNILEKFPNIGAILQYIAILQDDLC